MTYIEHKTDLISKIENVNAGSFRKCTLELHKYQLKYNRVYRTYVQLLRRKCKIEDIDSIPFLPISCFKYNEVVSGKWDVERIFKSSGTKNDARSVHYLADYNRYIEKSSANFFKSISINQDSTLLTLLSVYHENEHSSLISMIHGIKSQFKDFISLDELSYDNGLLERLIISIPNLVIFGVGYSLYDMAELYQSSNEITIISTGGTKGRRKEITSDELNKHILKSFPNASLISEYGMCELNSQFYSKGERFQQNPFAKVYVKDMNDPLGVLKSYGRGQAHVIDLWNIDSCAFIKTDDLVDVNEVGFKLLGRIDHSDIRGCNQLYLG